MEIEKNFTPTEVEKKWYDKWIENSCFEPNNREGAPSFTIVMPPPNVTGKLHLGHALDNTCQDILIRYKRMCGFNTLWIPGTDHAGIATQAVVEKKIFKETGKSKHDLGRETFLEEIWKWKEENGQAIIEQLKTIGISCDWNYLRFTLDKTPNLAVKTFFTQLFNEGLIYQAERIINWDVTLQSAISDAEVEYKEVKGSFYYLHYKVKESEEKLTIATTRPETLFGDTAVAVNPQDERFKHLIGKTAIVPICEREVPIIGDEHVDLELGTGCLKVTPGHDFNDFEIGQRHSLAVINILEKDGTFNDHAKAIKGMNVKDGRKKTIAILEEKEILVSTEQHSHQVAHGERSDSVVEPMVSKQWFLNVQEMAKQAVEVVENEQMKFFPKRWENTFFSWMREPKDWCLSRQLWWGHQIPVFYCQSCSHTWASVDDPTNCPECQSDRFKQDPDVLDTWFSSGLWPLSTLGWPDKKEMEEKKFDQFFPTNVLVTGFDIIFFWVARMTMMSMKIKQIPPFSEVYIHGIVRDKQGRKMSKSLGNGIDPIEVIHEHGCDAVRFTLASGCGHNQSFNLDIEQIVNGRNFINKIWNAFRFVSPNLELSNKFEDYSLKDFDLHEKWILGELNLLTKNLNYQLGQYRFDEASHLIYSFVYDKFCSWFIELSKTILYGEEQESKARRATVLKHCFEQITKLIHPILPFLSEEIWSKLGHEEFVMLQEYPQYDPERYFEDTQAAMNEFINIVQNIRNLRASVQLKPKDEIECHFLTEDKEVAKFIYQQRNELKHLAKVVAGTIKSKDQARPEKSVMSATSLVEIFIPVEGLIDIEKEINRLNKQIDKLSKEQEKNSKKLNNQNFIKNAPEEVVTEVEEKNRQLLVKIESIQKSLDGLN
jgi:valyl-tRNA synthetase